MSTENANTLEQVQAQHERVLEILNSEPAARAYADLRRKWSAALSDLGVMEKKLAKARREEGVIWAALKDAKALLSPTAQEYLG